MSSSAPRAIARRSSTQLPLRPQISHPRTNNQHAPSSRQFSQSTPQQFHASCQRATRLRRNMYAWLAGPGSAFREPLPKSTNYLSAYERSGRLKRAPRFNIQRYRESQLLGLTEDPRAAQEDGAKEENAEGDEEGSGIAALKKQRQNEDSPDRLPREQQSDMRPYPLNHNFRSQSVLSEGMREQIYTRIVEQGHSVTMVSTDLGVDMRRVAAVVRLKAIERDWVAQVS